MEIRKLTASDHDRAAELYSELDELHVQARPDYFVHREKDAIYPKDSCLHNLSDPCFLELGAFDGEQLIGAASAALWNNSGMVKDVKTVFLENIYVSPAYRRRGAAGKLFAQRSSAGQGNREPCVWTCMSGTSTKMPLRCISRWG